MPGFFLIQFEVLPHLPLYLRPETRKLQYMKKLLIGLSALLWASSVVAQEGVELDAVVLSDKRMRVSLSEIDRNLQIITKNDIQNTPALSIEELLAYQSGIDIRQRGINGAQADIGIRGSSFEQVLILINGVRMSDVQTGHHSLDLPIQLDAIQKIEVIKGPSARRFGQNAYAGVVNIITNLSADFSLETQIKGGEFGAWGIHSTIQSGGEDFRQMIGASYFQTDGYRHNTDVKKHDFWYQNQLKFGSHQMNFQAGFIEKKFGANGFYATPTATEQYEETQSSVGSLSADFNWEKFKLNTSVYWRRHQDIYLFVRDNPSLYRNMHIGNTVGADANLTYSWKLGETALGLEGRREFLSSNNLGRWNRTAASLFLEHKFEFFNKKLSITPGALWTDYNDFDNFFYPGVDVGYSINAHHRLYANVGKTYRTPTYTDLYYVDSVTEGNENLKPEEALAYELGYRFRKSGWEIQANVFARDSKNLIDWVKSSEEEKWHALNIAKVELKGIEIFAEYQFKSSFVHHISIGYTYLDNRLTESDGHLSKYILDHLKHQFTAKLNHKVMRNMNLEWVYRYNDRITLDDYQLLDAKLKWKNTKWEIFVQANNLFNTSYTETNLIPMPGRWFSGGVVLRLGARS